MISSKNHIFGRRNWTGNCLGLLLNIQEKNVSTLGPNIFVTSEIDDENLHDSIQENPSEFVQKETENDYSLIGSTSDSVNYKRNSRSPFKRGQLKKKYLLTTKAVYEKCRCWLSPIKKNKVDWGDSFDLSPLRHQAFNSEQAESVAWIVQGDFNNYRCGTVDSRGNFFGKSRFFNSENDNFIEGKWEDQRLVELHSCLFESPSTGITVFIKTKNDKLFLSYNESEFVGEIQMYPFEFTKLSLPFEDVMSELIDHITFTDILEDRITNRRNNAFSELWLILNDHTSQSVNNLEHAENLYQIFISSHENDKVYSNIVLLNNLFINQHVTHDLKEAFGDLLKAEQCIFNRDKYFSKSFLNVPSNSLNFTQELKVFSSEKVSQHRDELLSACDFLMPELKQALNFLSDEQVLFINKTDIELLRDVKTVAHQYLLDGYVIHHQTGMLKRLETYRTFKSVKSLSPLTCNIYLYLFMSLSEMVNEIAVEKECCSSDLIVHHSDQWRISRKLEWANHVPEQKSIKKQCELLLKLLEHFKPGGGFDSSKFIYNYKLLGKRHFLPWPFLKRSIRWYSDFEFDKTSMEKEIWIYIFDTGLAEVFLNSDNDTEKYLLLYNKIILGYLHCAEISAIPLEFFRVLTHKTIHFVALTSVYYSQEKTKPSSYEIYQGIITSQIKLISQSLLILCDYNKENYETAINFINECNTYWKNWVTLESDLLKIFPYKPFKKNLQTIFEKLTRISRVASIGSASPEQFKQFFGAFNSFVNVIKNLKLIWFIKKNDICNLDLSRCRSSLRLVHNEEIRHQNTTYEVVNPLKFIDIYKTSCSGSNENYVPHHYTLHVILSQLDIVQDALLKREWADKTLLKNWETLDVVQILLDVITTSLPHLTEITEFHDFNEFARKLTEPFIEVLQSSSSLFDFKSQIETLKIAILNRLEWSLTRLCYSDCCRKN